MKKEISYTGLVKIMMDKARKESSASGKQFDTKEAFSSAATRWKSIKEGKDSEYIQGKSPVVTRKTRSLKSKSKKQKEMSSDNSCEEIFNKIELCHHCELKLKKFLSGKKNKSRKIKS